MTIALNLASAARRALSTCGALALFAALIASPALAQDGDSAPAADDVETGMPLAADALRAELARIELDLATTRDFASAEPALAELMLRVLRAGEFDGWRELLADVHVARVNLLLDMGRVDEAGELAGQVGAEWGELSASEQGEFRERMAAIADAPSVVAARERVQAWFAREQRGGASDLSSLVDAALKSQGWGPMDELGELAVPRLLELLQPDAAFDAIYRGDPLKFLVRLVPERFPTYLDERVPEPSAEFLRRLQHAVIGQGLLRAPEAWVGCDEGNGRFAWPEWIPWIARMVRERVIWEEQKLGSMSVVQLLDPFLTGDASTPQLNDAFADLLSEADETVLSDAVQRLERIAVTSYSAGTSPRTTIRRLASWDSLVDRLLFHPDRRLRRLAAQLSTTRTGLGLLRHAVNDADPEVRAHLAGAFGKLMLTSISSTCGRRTSGAGRALERGPVDLAPGDEALLLRLARDDVDPVQFAALASLAESRIVSLPGTDAEAIWQAGSVSIRAALLPVPVAPGAAWVNLIRSGLESKAPAVQLAAAEALEREDFPVTAELYEFARSRPEARSRLAALRSASRAVPERLEDELIAFLDDDSELVRDHVVVELDHITSSASLVRVGTQLSSRSAGGFDHWLQTQLYDFERARFPEALVALVEQDFARGDSPAAFGSWSPTNGHPLDALAQHAPGLRAITRWAIVSGRDFLWRRVLGLTAFDGEIQAVSVESQPREAAILYWDAWSGLSDEDLAAVLDALRDRDAMSIARTAIIEKADAARLARVLPLSPATDAIALLGWRKVGLDADAALRRAALDGLARVIVAHPGELWIYEVANSNRGVLHDIDPGTRAEWLIDRIELGISPQAFSALIDHAAAESFAAQFVAASLRRRFVETFVRRWGLEPEALLGEFTPGVLRGVFQYAAPFTELVPDAKLAALGETPSLRWAIWDVVEARKSDVFLPMVADMLLVNQQASVYLDVLALLRAYPDDVAEPMLIDAAQRTASVKIRDACLDELEQRARVRDARSAYESRQRDEAAHAQALTDILALLDDPDALIRAEAARALGTLGSAAQLPRLIALLRDDGAEVRKAAREAIDRIHGRDAPAQAAEPEEPAEATDG